MKKIEDIKQTFKKFSNPATTDSSKMGSNNSSPELLNYFEKKTASLNKVPDLICFSHLRWDFVYQRPQHLLSRCAKDRRVFFVEEPIFAETLPRLEITERDCGVYIVRPLLSDDMNEAESNATLQALLIDELILEHELKEYICWYYTPMAFGFTQHLEPLAVIYDCMDELSAFKNPPKGLREREQELLERADLVFTGGFSLYEAKRHLHPSIYPFPSSIEAAHFRQSRQALNEPDDQADIPHPRLGFYGVVDERFDIELLDGLAKARPDWHFVIVGPVVKIDLASLPRSENIHYLGGKSYQELPAYLSGWDIAMLLFARNESTRFISPTKTPEYLAAGVPTISTSIKDVIRPYGQQGLVKIADTVEEFVTVADNYLSPEFNKKTWLRQVDEALLYNSWDRTWARMLQLINRVLTNQYAESGQTQKQVSPLTGSLLKSVVASQVTGD
jgi:glycosyltransferase involved in cell wall biosynthesis